jgi:putative glutamine amidotransferase
MTSLIAVAGRIGTAGKVSRTQVAFAGRRYLDAIRRAHAEPVTLTPRRMSLAEAERLLGRFDGLVLMGGPDVSPALYGQDPHESVYGVNDEQDSFEFSLLGAAAQMQFPTLAVCRGLQAANVAFGGTLVQHLGDMDGLVDHAPAGFPAPPEGVLHGVELMTDSRIHSLMGERAIKGASYHHQAIDRLADGLLATGHSDDGIIEVVEHDDDWLVGVQWHPEDTAEHDRAQQSLFNNFVAWSAGR